MISRLCFQKDMLPYMLQIIPSQHNQECQHMTKTFKYNIRNVFGQKSLHAHIPKYKTHLQKL